MAKAKVGKVKNAKITQDKPVKNSRHIPNVTEAISSASGDFAPALSLTADCDRPPATGKP
mgnify:CR=1 FL=1